MAYEGEWRNVPLTNTQSRKVQLRAPEAWVLIELLICKATPGFLALLG